MSIKYTKYFLVLLIGIGAISCTEEKKKAKEVNSNGIPTKAYLKAEIKSNNDSLGIFYKKMMKVPNTELPVNKINDAIYVQLQYYKYYPNDAYSAECLDKVQQLFLQKKNYQKSLEYTDLLLQKFPAYKGKATLLLNAGSAGEVLKDTTLIRKYYTQLLTEYPKLDPDTKGMIEFRLQHLDLTFDEMIELQMKNISNK